MKRDRRICGIPIPSVTPLEWRILEEGKRRMLDASDLAGRMGRAFGQRVDVGEVERALQHLADLGMIRRVGPQTYEISVYGEKQLFPDITGRRGGGATHREDVEDLLDSFQREGYFTYADRGFGETMPDITLLRPKGLLEWDLEHPLGAEVECEPGRHPDRVRENMKKAAAMPILFYTRKWRWGRSIERIAREEGMGVVPPGELFGEWRPRRVAVLVAEGTPPEVVRRALEHLSRGYTLRVRGGRYLYARKKISGILHEVYLGRVSEDFREALGRASGERVSRGGFPTSSPRWEVSPPPQTQRGKCVSRTPPR